MIRKTNATDATAALLLPPSLDMVSVPRDGHCMFHALAISVPSFGFTHEEVREKIVAHIIHNWEHRTTFYCEWIHAKHPFETVETYKNRMLGIQKDWGDEPEIVAAASIFQTIIQTLEYVEGASALTSTIIECPGTIPQEVPGIRILRVGRNHYHTGILPILLQPAYLYQRTANIWLSLHTVFAKVVVASQNTTSNTIIDDTSEDIDANPDRQEVLQLGAFITNLLSVGEGTHDASSVNAVVGAASTATIVNEREVAVETHKKRKNFTNDTPYFDSATTMPHTLIVVVKGPYKLDLQITSQLKGLRCQLYPQILQ